MLILCMTLGLFCGCTAMNQDARINFLEGQMKDVLQKSAEWDVTSKDVRRKMADFASQSDTIQNQVQQLSGRIDEIQDRPVARENPLFSQQGISEDIRTMKEQLSFLEARVAELEKNFSPTKPTDLETPSSTGHSESPLVISAPPETAALPGLPAEEVRKEAPAPEDQQAYNEAMDAMKQKQYDKAIRLFRSFIKKYPGSDLNDNAQYWIGESYFAQKKYEEAIIEFEEVITQYPKGEKVPAALLKEGLSFQELKDTNMARQLLKKLVDQYPASEEAKVAQQKLKQI
ncbi:MAG: tol-pal system protein YbgF [bacterium]